MRSTSTNILIGFFCFALLLSLVPFRAFEGKPEMLGGEVIKLDDAIRFVQHVTPAAGENFLTDAQNAVLALEAVAEMSGSFIGEKDSKESSPNSNSYLFLPNLPVKIETTDFYSFIDPYLEFFASANLFLLNKPPEG
jgi:hypothetical protein